MKGKLFAFLIPVVYVFALLLVVSPSGVSAVVQEEDGDSYTCVANSCGTSEGTKTVPTYEEQCSYSCPTEEFSDSHLTCPSGYEIEYLSHPYWRNMCVDHFPFWPYKDVKEPTTESFNVSVMYTLDTEDNYVCNKPSAQSLNIPDWALGDFNEMPCQVESTETCENVQIGTHEESCDNAEVYTCPVEGTCPTQCGYPGGDEIDDGEGGKITCPATEACSVEVECTTTCGYAGGEVADGKGGYKVCPATAACPVVEEDEPEVKGTTDVVLADTGASDSSIVYLVEGLLVLGTLVSSTMFVKKYMV
ncbi:MAG: hypothetical protein AB9915_03035 [Candidatus Dojkabacteria bacterium]